MKRSKKLEKSIIEALEKVPNISLMCERFNISRQTIYRWMDTDIQFMKNVNQAMRMGGEYINDLAESNLINNIKSGDQKAVKYWLDNHKYNYMRPRPKEFWEHIFETNKEKLGGMFFIDLNGSIEYVVDGSRYKMNLHKDDIIFKEIQEKYKLNTIEFADFSGKEKQENIVNDES